ncbi:hypothetical protein WA026_006119 [Henosepilachna vigintioctopunctata]|uniref:Uncharacterized protein n=1 Tax=Henosepilachna vigintioctopunctata TaxID=420089 RepID=A0AAW1TJY4_9CUCU
MRYRKSAFRLFSLFYPIYGCNQNLYSTPARIHGWTPPCSFITRDQRTVKNKMLDNVVHWVKDNCITVMMVPHTFLPAAFPNPNGCGKREPDFHLNFKFFMNVRACN